jgi:hypothetical protein
VIAGRALRSLANARRQPASPATNHGNIVAFCHIIPLRSFTRRRSRVFPSHALAAQQQVHLILGSPRIRDVKNAAHPGKKMPATYVTGIVLGRSHTYAACVTQLEVEIVADCATPNRPHYPFPRLDLSKRGAG